jgi:hypothetical protein
MGMHEGWKRVLGSALVLELPTYDAESVLEVLVAGGRVDAGHLGRSRR